jgi:calcineurin-like phosphoesterase family protein
MIRYFIADTHFESPKLAKFRGYENTEAHDARLIDTINRTVDYNDRLYILGDFANRNAGKYRNMIRCRDVWLIFGNHDRRSWRSLFADARESMTVKLSDGFRVFLSHYPTIYWDGSHKGWGHLYGHTHGAREQTMDEMLPGRRSMDVGVDVTGGWPLSEMQVSAILQSRPGHDPVEFYQQNYGGFE